MEQAPTTIAPSPQSDRQSPSRETSSNGSQDRNGKPKQKRNKPTLSCKECVDHKTKCDRGRPKCLACVKRSTLCQYTPIADLIAASANGTKRSKSRQTSQTSGFPTSPTSPSGVTSTKCSIANITHPQSAKGSPKSGDWDPLGRLSQYQPYGAPLSDLRSSPSRPLSESTNSSGHLANGTSSKLKKTTSTEPFPTPMSVFGMGGEHPFANYWTCRGGLAEVIDVLPSKDQADILIAKYFEVIDPILPILDRPEFLKEYEQFWTLEYDGKCKYDAATISLHFVMYATATQYIELPSATDRIKTAEFYVSAGHQALRISSYLNRMTITTVQTMVIIFHFLVNDNHVSDAWTFSGITQRQAYFLQLNREPDLIIPHASIAEKNMRCKVWSAHIFQEIGIAMFLKLPSTAYSTDVGPHSLNYAEADKSYNFNVALNGGEPPIGALCSELTKTDISYCKSVWAFSVFSQENICGPRALGVPLSKSTEHKRDMISAFRSLYRSFPQPFGSYDNKRFLDPSRRVARQQISLTQSFFHAMMLICADVNPGADVIVDLYGTLEAAHEALEAYFAMHSLFGAETSGWWVYSYRAYEEATVIANLLAAEQKVVAGASNSRSHEYNLLSTAKGDIRRLLDVMRVNRSNSEFQADLERRFDHLQGLYDVITVI